MKRPSEEGRMQSGFANARCVYRTLLALMLLMSADHSVLQAQRADALTLGVRVLAPKVDSVAVANAPPLELTGCHVSRAVTVGLAGYLGYLIGEVAQFPLSLRSGSNESVAIDVAGTVSGIILVADAPLVRPLPLCPSELRTLGNRPTDTLAACRASRVVRAGLSAGWGAVAAGAAAIPFALSNGDKRVVNGLLIAL
ncbi:MAG: hypothetical protein ABJE10_14180, partial [bacterium]